MKGDGITGGSQVWGSLSIFLVESCYAKPQLQSTLKKKKYVESFKSSWPEVASQTTTLRVKHTWFAPQSGDDKRCRRTVFFKCQAWTCFVPRVFFSDRVWLLWGYLPFIEHISLIKDQITTHQVQHTQPVTWTSVLHVTHQTSITMWADLRPHRRVVLIPLALSKVLRLSLKISSHGTQGTLVPKHSITWFNVS